MKTSIYLGGPMRGLPDFNFPAFHRAAAALRNNPDYIVCNPAEHDEFTYGKELFQGNGNERAGEFDIRAALGYDCNWICKNADIVALLPGWLDSIGAMAEYRLAVALQLEVWLLHVNGEIMWRGPAKDVEKLLDDSVKKPDESNPKDLIGDLKPQLHLVPPASIIYTAQAMANGAAKYGPYNWRDKKVRSTVYIAAAMRHLASYLDGENEAQDSHIPHLAHASACLAILIDATETDCLRDDRPTPGNSAKLIDRLTTKSKI
jgi:hypothetical protein